MSSRNKHNWLVNVNTFESNWRNDPRLHLLHPCDVAEIGQKFENLKRTIFNERYSKKNQEIYHVMWNNIVTLVNKGNERMDLICSILIDLLED